MKRFHTIKTIALATLLLAVGTMAKAQSNQQVMVKEWRDGDYIVRRYIVADNTPHQAEYEIHYAINSATTATDFDQMERKSVVWTAFLTSSRATRSDTYQASPLRDMPRLMVHLSTTAI